MKPADDPDLADPPLTLADYERAAGETMSAEALGYIDGGAGDEITLRRQRGRVAAAGAATAGAGAGGRAATPGSSCWASRGRTRS